MHRRRIRYSPLQSMSRRASSILYRSRGDFVTPCGANIANARQTERGNVRSRHIVTKSPLPR